VTASSRKSSSPRTAQEWFELGNDLAASGDYPGAAEAYREAIRLDPYFDDPPQVRAEIEFVEKKAAEHLSGRRSRTRRSK